MGKENHIIPISEGILDVRHREAIGPALWEFLWCINRETRPGEEGEGWVLRGAEVFYERIAIETGTNPATAKRNIARLEDAGYIEKKKGQRGVRIRILNPKKWRSRQTKNGLTKDTCDSPQETSGSPKTDEQEAPCETKSDLSEKSCKTIFESCKTIFESCKTKNGLSDNIKEVQDSTGQYRTDGVVESPEVLTGSGATSIPMPATTRSGMDELEEIFHRQMIRAPYTKSQQYGGEVPQIRRDGQVLIDRIGLTRAREEMVRVCEAKKAEPGIFKSINGALVQIDKDLKRNQEFQNGSDNATRKQGSAPKQWSNTLIGYDGKDLLESE